MSAEAPRHSDAKDARRPAEGPGAGTMSADATKSAAPDGGGSDGGGPETGGEAQAREREVSLPTLTVLAVLVGVVAAFGAIALKFLITLIYNLSFYQTVSFRHDPAALGGESPLGPLIVAVPVIGGLIVVFLVRTFAPEARGGGVPPVMYAIYHQGGDVRGVVGIIKALASAISVGTGASVGREGPIIQVGASFGSTLARRLRLIRSQKITLLAAGAGAGIAATFNTPLGGVLFASEVLLPEISSRTFLPVVVATATSTYVYRLVLGVDSAFAVPYVWVLEVEPVNLTEIALAGIAGVILGVASYAFIKLLGYFEDRFEAMAISEYWQNVIGMTAVGLIGYAFVLATGHYHVLGVGEATIQNILNGSITGVVILLALFAGKLLATAISLGAGASGGVFSPLLFTGAALGAAIGAAGALVFPDSGISIATFAMIGMGGMVGGSTGAAMTAIVTIFEMTRDYHVIVPLVLAVAIAIGVRRALVGSDIFTIKLRQRGRHIPTDRSTNMFLVQPVTAIMSRSFEVLPADMRLAEALKRIDSEQTRIIVSDGQRLAGFVRFGTISHRPDRRSRLSLGDITSNAFVIATERNTLNEVITRMNRRSRSFAIVIRGDRGGVPRPDDITGIIDREEIAQAVIQNHYG